MLNAMTRLKKDLHIFSGMDAENFHTLALDNVPIFGAHNRTSAYRFVTLVDVSFPFSIPKS